MSMKTQEQKEELKEKYLYKMNLEIVFDPLTREFVESNLSTMTCLTFEQLCKLIDLLELPINKEALLINS